METVKKKQRQYDRVRAQCVQKTAKQFNLGTGYIRQIIAGTREHDEVRRYYQAEYEKLSAVMV